MSEAGPGVPDPTPTDSAAPAQLDLSPATQALEDLHGLLVDAGRGDRDPAEVRSAVASYLGDHGAALRTAASSLTEQVRLQTLQELYKWRAQLADQVATKSSADDAPRGT